MLLPRMLKIMSDRILALDGRLHIPQVGVHTNVTVIVPCTTVPFFG